MHTDVIWGMLLGKFHLNVRGKKRKALRKIMATGCDGGIIFGLEVLKFQVTIQVSQFYFARKVFLVPYMNEDLVNPRHCF